MERELNSSNRDCDAPDSPPPLEIYDEDPAPLLGDGDTTPDDLKGAEDHIDDIIGDLGEAVAAIIAAEEQTVLLQEEVHGRIVGILDHTDGALPTT